MYPSFTHAIFSIILVLQGICLLYEFHKNSSANHKLFNHLQSFLCLLFFSKKTNLPKKSTAIFHFSSLCFFSLLVKNKKFFFFAQILGCKALFKQLLKSFYICFHVCLTLQRQSLNVIESSSRLSHTIYFNIEQNHFNYV